MSIAPSSAPRTLAVAALVAFVCAVLVTTTHVLLKPRIEANIAAERAERMAELLSRLPALAPLLEGRGAAALESRLVALGSGEVVTGDIAAFDLKTALSDPEAGRPLPPEADIAGLGRLPVAAPVHILRDERGRLALVILPFAARGYQSTIIGMIALEPDLETVAALTILEQGDTPGLGARVASPEWQALWPGRRIVDDEGRLAVTVVRDGADAPWEVDAISGATRSSIAVGNGVRLWLGPEGFGPFLERLKEEESA